MTDTYGGIIMNHTPCTKEELKAFLDYESKLYKRKNRGCPILALGERAIAYKYVYILRHTEFHHNNNHKVRALLWRIWLSKMQEKHGVKIPINVCGKGLRLVHVGSILVSNNAHIGENCSFHINTAIVAGGTSDDVPVIGSNVVIGIGAILTGGIHIPDGCAIGANALVNKSFDEENIGIAGVPARKISNKGRAFWGDHSKKES